MGSEKRPSFEVLYAADSAVMEQDKRFEAKGKRRSPADITGCAVAAAEPLIRQQVLEEIRERLFAVAAEHRDRTRLRVFVLEALPFDSDPTALQAAIASIRGRQ